MNIKKLAITLPVMLLLFFQIPAYAVNYFGDASNEKVSFLFGLAPFFQSTFGSAVLYVMAALPIISGVFLCLYYLDAKLRKIRKIPTDKLKQAKNLKIASNLFILSLALFPCACGINEYFPILITVSLIFITLVYIAEKNLTLQLRISSIEGLERFNGHLNLCVTLLITISAVLYIVAITAAETFSLSDITIFEFYKQPLFKAILSAIVMLTLWYCMKFFIAQISKTDGIYDNYDKRKTRRIVPDDAKSENLYDAPLPDDSLYTIITRKFELNIYILCFLLNISFLFWGFAVQQVIIPLNLLSVRFLVMCFLGALSFYVKFKKHLHEHAYLYLIISYCAFFLTTLYFGVSA